MVPKRQRQTLLLPSSCSDVDEPEPSTSGLRRRPASSASRRLTSPYFSSDGDSSGDEYVPRRAEEDSDIGPSSEDELDYVSQADTTLDSDEPLSTFVTKVWRRNEPGSPNFVWRKKDNVSKRFGFAGSPGVKADLDETSSPLEIFQCFFTDDLLQHIIRETNRYAGISPPVSPHMRKWTPMSKEELMAYFGLRVTMGFHKIPCYRDFWSHHPTVRVPKDRLWKLRPVIDALNTAFVESLVPEKDIAIDESLWKFHGRLRFVTFNKNKRARFGLKVYKLSASTGPSSGYTSCFRIYTGQDKSTVPASTKAVLDLLEMSSSMGKGYCVFVDNWYTSPSLFHILQSRRTNAVGTVRVSRKWMPRDLTVKRRGDVDYRSSNTGLLALQWRDRNVVTMLSTVHNAQVEEGGKPRVVADYNVGMKGVDVGDQFSASYSTPRKSRVWYRKIFFFLFDLALVNSFAVYRTMGGRMPQKEFRMELAMQMIGDTRSVHSICREAARPTREVRSRLQQRGHSIQSVPDGKRLRCRWCSARGVRKATRSRCADCLVGLCTYGCFEAWHSAT
ncbi:piggyBac transposable element-derived protein 4-like [Penaeus japonicus]|uniref:piggyBac transposable element-derived protein 4-like n=1 Tax=Penaeus japonicus TaxID=27405 RepID=UPI001C70DADE|nr:piggyBac transposable element-derived protein 4-like [Penaeus japonicus]